MRLYWVDVTPDGRHDIVAGMLREKQFELALEEMNSMRRDLIQIQPWLYDLTIYSLIHNGEFDEAMSIMKYRTEVELVEMPINILYTLLDTASRSFHV